MYFIITCHSSFLSFFFFFSSRRRHTRCSRDWSSDVCSSDLVLPARMAAPLRTQLRLGHHLDDCAAQHLAFPAQGEELALHAANAKGGAGGQGYSRALQEVFHARPAQDRKSTRLNSSHRYISYHAFCLIKTH